jgi:hypothetical protein
MLNVSVRDQLRGHGPGRVTRNREAEAGGHLDRLDVSVDSTTRPNLWMSGSPQLLRSIAASV